MPAVVILAWWEGVRSAPTVPSASWVYPFLDEVRLREETPPFFVMTGPYPRTDLAEWLGPAASDTSSAGRRSRWLRRMLCREMSPELRLAQARGIVVTCEGVLSSDLETDMKVKPQTVLSLSAYSREGLDVWGLFRASDNASGYHKTAARPWRGDLRASFDQGGVGYTKGPLSLFVGRDEMAWGLSRQGGLLLSGSAPSMDMVRLSLRTGGFRFTTFQSQLRGTQSDSWEAGVRRYLSGHRAEFLAGQRLGLSLSEVVVYGGEGRTLEVRYSNPLAPLYAEQWNSGSEDNVLAACDCALLFPGRGELRCEVLIDDFQIDKGSEPHEVGFGLEVLGLNPLFAEGSLVGSSYRLVTNRTYGHRVPWNRFTQEGVVMGYPAGPDGDRFDVWASLAVGEPCLITLGYELVRRGKGRAADSQEEPAVSLRFPSGVAEKTQTVAAEVAWRPSFALRVKANGRWSATANAGNIAGNDDRTVRLGLWVEYVLRSTRSVGAGGTGD